MPKIDTDIKSVVIVIGMKPAGVFPPEFLPILIAISHRLEPRSHSQ